MPYLARAPEDGVSRRPMSSKSLRVGMCANRTHGPVYASAQSDQYSIGALYRYQRMQLSFRQKTRTLIRLCRCADCFENLMSAHANLYFITPGRRQSKTLILSTNVDKKIVRNRVFHCHLSPNWRQMAIENTVSSDFDPRSSIVQSVFDCRLTGVFMLGASSIV